ncbi:MAG: CNNM domain-containing protein [Thermoguttaceae bacterium]|nr:CNNM domain-containing protein [Thermoguttaceae bacterium]
MDWWLAYLPWWIAMGGLLGASGFFSASEAALFSLTPADRRRFACGSQAEQLASRLLQDADRVLTAVLFWNLLVNVLYFTIASIVGLQLQAHWGPAGSALFGLVALLSLIVLSEVVPKSLAVLQPRWVARWVSLPLEGAIRLVEPLLPALRQMARISQRVLCPRFEPEPYLHLQDLERAVELAQAGSSSQTPETGALLRQQHEVLQGLVNLSEMRIDELMRPRRQLAVFRPPVQWQDIHQNLPPTEYLFLSDLQTDEIVAAVNLRKVTFQSQTLLSEHAEPVLYVPWSISVAEAFQQMLDQNSGVAVVINEYGETIGAVTFEEVMETLFQPSASRSQRLLHRPPFRQVRPGVWEVTGITSLRRLARHFALKRPTSRATTVAGLLLEILGRFPAEGDTCQWGPLEFRVLRIWPPMQMLVEVRMVSTETSA